MSSQKSKPKLSGVKDKTTIFHGKVRVIRLGPAEKFIFDYWVISILTFFSSFLSRIVIFVMALLCDLCDVSMIFEII